MTEAIKPAFRRLFDAQSHWHNAEKSYFEPDSFRIAINSCIQELRNVTFVLQNNKRSIEGFNAWYEPWQEKMRANNSLRWLVNARNRIVKQGDLDIYSTLRISVVGSYRDSENPIFERLYEPRLTNEGIAKSIIDCGLPKEILENAYVKVERRWIDKNTPDHELLDLLSICWSAIAELLSDAPSAEEGKEQKFKSAKVPPCMHHGSETRSTWMKIAENELAPTEIYEQELHIDNSSLDEIKKRYRDSPMTKVDDNSSDFKEICDTFFRQAMYLLKKDGHHIHLAVIFVDSKPVEIIQLENEDQADKYRTMRLLASEIEKIGANKFLMTSEVWTAPFDPKNPYRHAVDSPDRSEMLSLIGISQNGEDYCFSVSFTRDEGVIVFGEPTVTGVENLNIIKPIMSVWKKSDEKKH